MNKKIVIAIMVAAIVALAGGYYYAQKQHDENSVSLSIGDKKLSISAE
jgi:hypothetical protein